MKKQILPVELCKAGILSVELFSRTKKFFTVTAFFVGFIFAPTAYGADHYVSPTGNGTSYTEASPGNFKNALAHVTEGDTILLMDGIYQDTSITSYSYSSWISAFSPSYSGTETAPITIKAVNRLGAIIDAPNVYHTTGNPKLAAIGIKGNSYITIDGLRVRGMVGVYGQEGGGDHNIIKNCEVTIGAIQGTDTSLNYGIVVTAGATNNLIQNNYVHDIHDSGNHGHNSGGIMLLNPAGGPATTENIIEYNTVDSGNVLGTVLGTKGGYNINDNIWRYNFGMNGYGTAFIEMGSTGSSEYGSFRNIIHNNIIINTPYFLDAYHSGSDWQIYNNTFYNPVKSLDGQSVEFLHMADNAENVPFGERPCKNQIVFNNLARTGINGYYQYYNASGWWNESFAYSDYNQFYDYSYWCRNYSSNMALSYWRDLAFGFDSNSITTDPEFLNTSDTFSRPADFKRSSYPAAGRGGPYPSVIGAYVTGDETVGYTAGEITSNEKSPGAPSGLAVS